LFVSHRGGRTGEERQQGAPARAGSGGRAPARRGAARAGL